MQREVLGFALTDTQLPAAWFNHVEPGGQLTWGGHTYIWDAAVPQNVETGQGSRRSWFICNAITYALGQREQGWRGMYPHTPADFQPADDDPFAALSWDALTRLFDEALHSQNLSVLDVARRMDMQLHWSQAFQERLVAAAEPLFARDYHDHRGGVSLAMTLEAWCMQLVQQHVATAQAETTSTPAGSSQGPFGNELYFELRV